MGYKIVCMNEEITQKKVTLESLSDSIESIAKSIGGLTVRVDGIDRNMVPLVTKEEVKNLEHQFVALETTINGQTVDIKKRMDGLTLSIEDLPTRKEMNTALNDTEQRLKNYIDTQINDLAFTASDEFTKIGSKFTTINDEFTRINVKLDDLQKYTVEFRQQFDLKSDNLQKQLDNIYTSYPNRAEFDFLDKRVKRIEKVVFV